MAAAGTSRQAWISKGAPIGLLAFAAPPRSDGGPNPKASPAAAGEVARDSVTEGAL